MDDASVKTSGPSAPQGVSTDNDDAIRPLLILSESRTAKDIIQTHVRQLVVSAPASLKPWCFASDDDGITPLDVGLAALDAFLQANVTGPVLSPHLIARVEERFASAWRDNHIGSQATLPSLGNTCLKHLGVDGVAPYAYIPYLELFSLARYILVEAEGLLKQGNGTSWMRLRLHVWHYKLLTQPSLGPGSNFTKSSQWSDVPTLASTILEHMDLLLPLVSDYQPWSQQEKAQFLIEAANNYILLGHYEKAKKTLRDAAQVNGLVYALSGALGKRTKFQDKDTSQLVVLARGRDAQVEGKLGKVQDDAPELARPEALQLNDDTLLEDIDFAKDGNNGSNSASLPLALLHFSPDEQPQLSPLDQIILLTEATLKDAFSPADSLTAEEMLPFAARVLADKSTNWQIFTQALLVRSRIEIHRSRTVERGVLQLQALADQVIVDTSAPPKQSVQSAEAKSAALSAPTIKVTGAEHSDAHVKSQVASSFLPAAKASESASANVRLRYIHALSTPPRWHLESELAYAWAGVGSLVSALEIFKRLRLWAEVALCFASAAAAEDEHGRGSGGEDKARAVIRWRLFHGTDDHGLTSTGPDDEGIEDLSLVKASDYSGPERTPPPPNAPRLWCILGDLENNPSHYTRAWHLSQKRYARAQKSLGEYYVQQRDWPEALGAYQLATAVNRLNPDLWCRLGDINLRLGHFEEAAEAYNRSIACTNDMAGGEDARTWSNLGSALWSLYSVKAARGEKKETTANTDQDGDQDLTATEGQEQTDNIAALLSQSLAAYKKGASIAHDNWRIWDNVLTLAARVQPVPIADMVLALKHIIRIRRTEDAIDATLLTALVQDAVLSRATTERLTSTDCVYQPPRGSPERLVTRLVEDDIVPLITRRSDLWALVSRLRGWRYDYAAALDASERAWRAAAGSSGSGLLAGADAAAAADWTIDEAAWSDVVQRTDELVSALANWGPDVLGLQWRARARSALRSIMGRARDPWQGSEGWTILENHLEHLKVHK
ncbi:hypothetical protein CDD81_1044 [Ophiocordyceps australis]|uniref:Uncharacterized protein n=1 Tax=Ophiocordyceps australis TaxID=1399860 RepID=A0A2C5XZV8_9HYPO|nr:hypothetical protein CDD81_1044 [Ophiocordyceps australis]